jgi:sortase A
MLLDARFYQAEQARRFDQALKGISAVRAESRDLPVPEGAALGRIEISRVGLKAMVQEGIDERTLRHAVGHIPGTPLPGQRGNVAFAGHRDTFFRGLRNVRLGDEITVTTLNGTYNYHVNSTKVVKPEETEVLDATNDDILTLVTCYPFNFVGSAPRRFIVRAHRITK